MEKEGKTSEYFSITEAAKKLRISRVAVFKRIQKGALRAIKIGRSYAIPKGNVLGSVGDSLEGESIVPIPILGTANAGDPLVYASESHTDFLKVSKRRLPSYRKGKFFVVQIKGTSMNKCKVNGKIIDDGDYVLIDERQIAPEDGRVILVVLDNCATIKIIRHIGESEVGFFPLSNDSKHKPIYVHAEDHFIINGTVVDVFKDFKNIVQI